MACDAIDQTVGSRTGDLALLGVGGGVGSVTIWPGRSGLQAIPHQGRIEVLESLRR